jgi:hypothetical protein
MLDTNHVFQRTNIRTESVIFAVADTANLIMEASSPVHTASKLFMDVLSVQIKFDDVVFARIAAKHMVKDVVISGCVIDPDDVDMIVEQALEYATTFCADAANSYLWSKPDDEGSLVPQQVTAIEGIELQVAVNDNGKIKKGGKALLAAELFQTYVLDAEVPLTNIELVAMLMEKLDMTKAGATTYGYNCRKNNGPAVVMTK